MRALLGAVVLAAVCVPILAPRWVDASQDEARHLGRPVSAWRADLASEDAQTRFDALVAIGMIGPDADAALGDVAARLADPHPQIRERAAGTLALLGGKGYDAVIAMLGSRDAAMRAICCDVLTWGSPPRRKAAKALRPLLGDEAANVRYLAAFALTAVDPKSDDPLPVLQQALGTTSAPAVIGACHAAARLGHRARPLLRALLGVFRFEEEKALVAAAQALRGMDPSVLPRLIARIAELDANPSGRIVLFGVIAHLGRDNPDAAQALIPALVDANTQVALAAVDAIEAIGVRHPGVVRALEARAALAGRDALVAPKAIELLGAWGHLLPEALVTTLRGAVAGKASPETFGTALSGVKNGLAVFGRVLDTQAPVEQRIRWLRGLVAAAGTATDARWRNEARRVLLALLAEGPAPLRAQAAEHAPLVFPGDASILEALAEHAEADACGACARVAAETLVRVLEERDAWHTAGEEPTSAPDPAPYRTAGLAMVPLLKRLVGGEDLRASLAARIALAYLRPDAEDAVAGCVEALGGMDLPLRRAAAACLATIEPGTPAVVEALARVVANRNENPVVRRTAAVALARQGDAALGLVETKIQDLRGPERRFWLVAMGRAGTRLKALLPAIVEDVESDREAARDAAVEVIRAMGAHAATIGPDLAALLGKRSLRRRAAAMRALAAMGAHARPWVGPMFDAVVREQRGERARFAGQLAELGEDAVPVLAKAAATGEGWERRLVAINVLARIGPPAAAHAKAIAGALSYPDSSVRVAACDLLAVLGPDAAAAAPALVKALEDPVGRVRAQAAAALAALGPEVADAARETLRTLGANDRHAFVRAEARKALRMLGSSVEREDDR